MELTKQQIEAIKPKSTEELLSDFYFLIFTPNPARNMVRVFIDDGTIKLWTDINRFIQTIKIIMNEEIAQAVKAACTTYGCFFEIDRCDNSIRKLNIKSEENIINIKQLRKDIEGAKAAGEKDEVLQKRFLAAIQQPIQERLSRQTRGNSVAQSKFSSTIVYGDNPHYGGYRPY